MRNRLRDALKMARKFVYAAAQTTGRDVLDYDRCGKPYIITPQYALEKIDDVLAVPIRNCDLFGGDPKKLHELWWEWSGDLKNCNADGTVKFTFGEWLLKPADAKGGAQ